MEEWIVFDAEEFCCSSEKALETAGVDALDFNGHSFRLVQQQRPHQEVWKIA